LAALWGLTLKTPEGAELSLSNFKGKPLLVNFWATWCPPCIEELPLLNAFYQQNASKGWQMLGLAVDKTSAVQVFLAREPLAFPVVMAGMEGVALSQSLGNGPGGLPFTVVLGTTGEVLDRKIGRVSPDDLQRWDRLK
jgi:thiol-disulfide isomerase/thioredoxin